LHDTNARLWHPWRRISRVLRVMRDVSNIGDVDLEIAAEELLGEVMLAPARDRRYCPRGYGHFKEEA
jgi:hypothetical protein